MNTFEKWVFFVNMFSETICAGPFSRSRVVEAAMEVNTNPLEAVGCASIPHCAKECVEWWVNCERAADSPKNLKHFEALLKTKSKQDLLAELLDYYQEKTTEPNSPELRKRRLILAQQIADGAELIELRSLAMELREKILRRVG